MSASATVPVLMLAPSAALSAQQLNKIQELIAPADAAGVLSIDNMCLGGAPISGSTIGALKTLLYSAEGSHLLDLSSLDHAGSVLLAPLMMDDPASAPSSDLCTAIVNRLLHRIHEDAIRPSPIPRDGPWSAATAVECANKDWTKAVHPAVLNGQADPSSNISGASSASNVIDASQSEANAEVITVCVCGCCF